jgi:hypothetical protein
MMPLPPPDSGRRGSRRLPWLFRGPTRRASAAGWAWRVALWAAGLAVILSSAVYLVLAMHGHRVPYAQLWLAFCAGLLILAPVRALAQVPTPVVPPTPPAPAEREELRAGPFARADWWQRRLATTDHDVAWFDRVVRARLVHLVAERLRQRHGLSLTADPARAAAVTGHELFEFLTAPLPRTPTPYELDLLISRMEEI